MFCRVRVARGALAWLLACWFAFQLASVLACWLAAALVCLRYGVLARNIAGALACCRTNLLARSLAFRARVGAAACWGARSLRRWRVCAPACCSASMLARACWFAGMLARAFGSALARWRANLLQLAEWRAGVFPRARVGARSHACELAGWPFARRLTAAPRASAHACFRARALA